MSKKTELQLTVVDAAISNRRTTGDLEIEESAMSEMAVSLNLDLTASIEDRFSAAIEKTNNALYLVLQAGVLYASVKAELPHGKFLELLDERGVSHQRTRECMSLVRAVAGMSHAARLPMMQLPKSKAIALASLEPDVAEALLIDRLDEVKDMSVRGLVEHIRKLKAEKADAETAAETAEWERNALQDQLQQATKPLRKSARPLLVEDIQQETAVQVIAHDLALSRLQEQLHDASGLQGGALQEWAAATQGTVFAAIVAAHAKTCALLQSAIDAGLATTDYSGMAVTAALSDAALDSVVSRAADLLRVEDYEKRLRAWQREQDRPRGKGRPMAKPELAE